MTIAENYGPYSIGGMKWPGISKLIEEMGELQQILGKIMATDGSLEHWQGDLGTPLHDELADVMAAVSYFCHANGIDTEYMNDRKRRKYEVFWEWHKENPERKPVSK